MADQHGKKDRSVRVKGEPVNTETIPSSPLDTVTIHKIRGDKVGETIKLDWVQGKKVGQSVQQQNLSEADAEGELEYIELPDDKESSELEYISFSDWVEKHEEIVSEVPGNSKKKTGIQSLGRKIQFAAALLLTIVLVGSVPTYSWFTTRREIARLERIDSPNSLFITAAHREAAIYLEIGGIDVNAKWSDGNQMNYKDYVFSVAGAYVNSFTLQLAHTTNNAYTYEIFEAAVTADNPSASEVEGKDYVAYTLSNMYPVDLPTMPDNDGVIRSPGTTLYYRIRQGKDSENQTVSVSLNAQSVSDDTVTPSSYTIGESTVRYDGHYLNLDPGSDPATMSYLALSSGSYHNETYESYGKVDSHAEPLYWQATGIAGGNAASKSPFYHEYILRVSWLTNSPDTYQFKDTDIICISAKAE